MNCLLLTQKYETHIVTMLHHDDNGVAAFLLQRVRQALCWLADKNGPSRSGDARDGGGIIRVHQTRYSLT